jgi:hypothetical protein
MIFSRLSAAPDLLIILSARFHRVSWKYESIPYALILKDVGVILQTMYLVATAMGMAPCALGGGNSVAFSRAAGLDFWLEGSVGEFMLGSCSESLRQLESSFGATSESADGVGRNLVNRPAGRKSEELNHARG